MYKLYQFKSPHGTPSAYLVNEDDDGNRASAGYFVWRPGDELRVGKWEFYTPRNNGICYLNTDRAHAEKGDGTVAQRPVRPTTLPCERWQSPNPSLLVYEGNTTVRRRGGPVHVRVRATAFNRDNGSFWGRTCTLVEEYIDGAWRKIGTVWQPDLPGVPFPYSPEWRTFWRAGELQNVWAQDYLEDAAEHFLKKKHPGFSGHAVNICDLRDSFAPV